jgi:hypothetical protein
VEYIPPFNIREVGRDLEMEKIQMKGGEWMRIKKGIKLMTLLIAAALINACATSQTTKAPAEPTVEYFKLDGGKLVPGKVKANAYFEVSKDGKIYVFISPKAKAEWEKTGKLHGKPVTGIGYGPNGETVMFESETAQKEYDKRHEIQ